MEEGLNRSIIGANNNNSSSSSSGNRNSNKQPLGFVEYRQALLLVHQGQYEEAKSLLYQAVHRFQQQLGDHGARSYSVLRNVFLLVFLLRLQNTTASVAEAQQVVQQYRSTLPQLSAASFTAPTSPLRCISFDSSSGTSRFEFLAAEDAPHFYGPERRRFDRSFELNATEGEYVKKVKYYQLSKKGDNSEKLTDLTFVTSLARQACFRERIPFFSGLRRRELTVHSSTGGIVGLRRYADQPKSPLLGLYTLNDFGRERHAKRTTAASSFNRSSSNNNGGGYSRISPQRNVANNNHNIGSSNSNSGDDYQQQQQQQQQQRDSYLDSFESSGDNSEFVIMTVGYNNNNSNDSNIFRRMPSSRKSARPFDAATTATTTTTAAAAGGESEQPSPMQRLEIDGGSSKSTDLEPNTKPDYLEGLSIRLVEEIGTSYSQKSPQPAFLVPTSATAATAAVAVDGSSPTAATVATSAATVGDRSNNSNNESCASLWEGELDDTPLLLQQATAAADGSEFSFGSFGSYEDAAEKVSAWDGADSWNNAIAAAAAATAGGENNNCCIVC